MEKEKQQVAESVLHIKNDLTHKTKGLASMEKGKQQVAESVLHIKHDLTRKTKGLTSMEKEICR